MDLDVIVMKFRELQAQVAEIREKLGLAEKKEEKEETTTQPEPNPDSAEEVADDEEEVEEHDPELGHPVKRKRKKR